MTSKLTRETVFNEVKQLQRRFDAIDAGGFSSAWLEEYDDVSYILRAGDRLTASNYVDFGSGELAVADLRGRVTRLETIATELKVR